MAINFDKLPDEGGGGSAVEGRYEADVFKAEMGTSKSGNEQLVVNFRLKGGGFVTEYYQDSDKPFMMYKLKRLLIATKVNLTGEGTLQDVAKVIRGKKLLIDIVPNEKGYAEVDYSKDKDGLYPIDTTVPDNNISEEVRQAIIEDTDDVPF